MAAAAMVAAGMTLLMVVLTVMVAADIGIEVQFALNQRLSSCVRVSGNAAVEFDARSSQRRLCTGTDTAADQRIHTQRRKHTGKGPVAAAIGIHHPGRQDSSILHLIYLKLLCMAKMLEDLALCISYCNCHNMISFLFWILP